MNHLYLIQLSALMELTSGRPEIVVRLIDGPVAINHPGLVSENIREIPGSMHGTCTQSNSIACIHGTFVAGISSAKRNSVAPAICPKSGKKPRRSWMPLIAARPSAKATMPLSCSFCDLTMEQGYYVAIIRHGKGNKRGLAKLPVEVRQAIDGYLEAAYRQYAELETPLFVSFRRGDHPQEKPLYPNQVERIVKRRAQAVGTTMSPHGMRVSFITFAFEGGADLTLVQDAARYKDSRTTRCYQKHRNNLHNNAVDFV
jgi:hypothetical protein